MLLNFSKDNKKKKYNILIYGNSTLEYALALKFKESKLLGNLYVANASEALKNIGIYLEYNGKKLIEVSKNLGIDIFICNDNYTIFGIIDDFKNAGIKCFGANKKWSFLEGSKHIGKKFTEKYKLNHPYYEVVTDISQFNNKIKKFSYPVVIKADGYARGIGTFICNNYNEALSKTEIILNKQIINTSSKVLIEEFIKGQEISYMQIWDGKHLKSLTPVKDFKKLYDGDKGPNTGGMASFCPYDLTKTQKNMLKLYSKKLEQILKKENADFVGIIYSGLIFTNNNMYILEYNMRFGSPETIALIKYLDCDLLEIIIHATNQNINNYHIKYKKGIGFAINFVCKDYPEGNKEQAIISKKDIKIIENNGLSVFYDDGEFNENNYIKNGGRAFCIAHNSYNPFDDIYNVISEINISDFKYRKDIQK